MKIHLMNFLPYLQQGSTPRMDCHPVVFILMSFGCCMVDYKREVENHASYVKRNNILRPFRRTMGQNQVVLTYQIIHFPTSSGVSEWVSDRVSEWVQRSARANQAMWSERCERTRKWTSGPLGCSEPLCATEVMTLDSFYGARNDEHFFSVSLANFQSIDISWLISPPLPPPPSCSNPRPGSI